MRCCCWSLPVGENPPTMYNAESISTDGDLRWVVLWEAIMPTQGGMQVLKDRYGRYVIREMSGDLLAVGVKDGNIHIAALDTSDGSESIALTDTGVAAEIEIDADGGFRGEAKEISGEIVLSAYEIQSTYVWRLVRIAVDALANCTRSESNDIDYTPSAFHVSQGLFIPDAPYNHFEKPYLFNTIGIDAVAILGVNAGGEAMLVGPKYLANDSTYSRIVSVDSAGQSGSITAAIVGDQLSQPRYIWFGTTGVANFVIRSGGGGVFEAETVTAAAPFSTTSLVGSTPQSGTTAQDSGVPFHYGFIASPVDSTRGWGYSTRDVINNTIDERLTVYDPTQDWKANPPVEFYTEDVCPNIGNPGVTISTGQDVESDGTLHIVLCSSNTNRTSSTDAAYGIVNTSGVEAVMLNRFPNHISGTGAKLSLDNDDNACCYWRTNRGDGSGYMAGLYKRYSGVILQEWAWFNLNELVDDVDASGNFYFADETPHEQSGLGKDEPLSFTLILDDTTWTFSNIGDPNHETWWRSNLNDQLLAYATGGTLTSQIDDTYSGGTSMLIDFELTISAGTTAGTALLTLDVVIDLTTEIGGNGVNGGISDVTVTYTLDNVDISNAQTVALTTAASVAARTLTFDAGPPAETILLPATLDVQIS